MLKLEDLQAEVTHALGGDPAAPHTTTKIVNRAGTHLFSMHQWKFTNRDPWTMQFVADEPRVDLPPDFGRALRMRSNGSTWIHLVGLSELSERDVANYESSSLSAYHGTIIYPADDGTKAHVYVTPTPTSDDSDVAKLWYEAGWVPLVSPGDTALVPPQIELLLIDMVREIAKGYEEDDMKGRLQAISQSTLYRDARRWDGSQQPAGVIQNGFWERPDPLNTFVTEEASDPS